MVGLAAGEDAGHARGGCGLLTHLTTFSVSASALQARVSNTNWRDRIYGGLYTGAMEKSSNVIAKSSFEYININHGRIRSQRRRILYLLRIHTAPLVAAPPI